MNLREDKWEILVVVSAAVSTGNAAVEYHGWARLFWLALGIFCVSAWCREIRKNRRKRRELRRAWLAHFDRLMRDEVKRR
ncbi:hypothetical protein [Streptomyces sp. NPDC051684]|uniref:hypothetical protein n=1 Tax=Streptomyces sp. NPDC051684 TaxID=3365670 RepID=UPI0037A538DD